jgi:hypothetical protein
MSLPPTLAALLATTNTDKSPQHGLPSLPDATTEQLEEIRDYIRSLQYITRADLRVIIPREAQDRQCRVLDLDNVIDSLLAERGGETPVPKPTITWEEVERQHAELAARDAADTTTIEPWGFGRYGTPKTIEPKPVPVPEPEPEPSPKVHETYSSTTEAPPDLPETPREIVPEPEPESEPLPTPWDRERIRKKFGQFVTLCQRECAARGEVVPSEQEIRESIGLCAPEPTQLKKRNRQQQEKESAKHGILAYMTLQPNVRFTVKQITEFLQTVKEQTVRSYLLELCKENKIEGQQIGTLIAPAKRGPNGKVIHQAKTTNMWYFWIPRL